MGPSEKRCPQKHEIAVYGSAVATLDQLLRSALKLPGPEYFRTRIPKPSLPGLGTVYRSAAVLVLFRNPEDPELLLTVRTDTVETHKGQIAFPGGACDPEDYQDCGVVTAALRETEEEVGIPRSNIEVLGTLPDLWTPSGFDITPVVGLVRGAVSIQANASEIAEWFWAPLEALRAHGTYRQEIHQADFGAKGQFEYPIHIYQLGGYRVWGATAAIIKNLLDRLKTVET
jgi:8-oxo-dGTP pyrophosphatase MutT (NUDIX family)